MAEEIGMVFQWRAFVAQWYKAESAAIAALISSVLVPLAAQIPVVGGIIEPTWVQGLVVAGVTWAGGYITVRD